MGGPRHASAGTRDEALRRSDARDSRRFPKDADSDASGPGAQRSRRPDRVPRRTTPYGIRPHPARSDVARSAQSSLRVGRAAHGRRSRGPCRRPGEAGGIGARLAHDTGRSERRRDDRLAPRRQLHEAGVLPVPAAARRGASALEVLGRADPLARPSGANSIATSESFTTLTTECFPLLIRVTCQELPVTSVGCGVRVTPLLRGLRPRLGTIERATGAALVALGVFMAIQVFRANTPVPGRATPIVQLAPGVKGAQSSRLR